MMSGAKDSLDSLGANFLQHPDHFTISFVRRFVKISIQGRNLKSSSSHEKLEFILVNPSNSHLCIMDFSTKGKAPSDILDLLTQIIILPEQHLNILSGIRMLKYAMSDKLLIWFGVSQESLKIWGEEIKKKCLSNGE